MFVASFLGNPPINYLQGAVEAVNGTTLFRRGEVRIALPAPAAARVSGSTGREVVLGIRPEDVCPPNQRPDASTISGTVETVLPVGSDRFLGLKIEGNSVFVRVDKQSLHREGEAVTLAIVPERLHLFDRATGTSLLAEPT
jgi:multiple sugar transport system ATP-binding protein